MAKQSKDRFLSKKESNFVYHVVKMKETQFPIPPREQFVKDPQPVLSFVPGTQTTATVFTPL